MKNEKTKLTRLIEKLPLISKQLLSLYYIEELNIKEISLVLETDENFIKREINRLIMDLKKSVEIVH